MTKRVKLLVIGGVILIMAGLLAGCLTRTYVIGKNPTLDAITSVRVGGGGMEYASGWSYLATSTSRAGEPELSRTWWDEERKEMRDERVSITGEEYRTILASIEGLRYVKHRSSSSVMDGDSQSAVIYWDKSPSGSWQIEFGDEGMAPLLRAMAAAWQAHFVDEAPLPGTDGTSGAGSSAGSSETAEPTDLTGITLFSFSAGPTDIAYGDISLTAEVDESGEVTVTLKESEQPPEEAATTTADATFLDDIVRVMREHGADTWNGFSGDNGEVLDGSSFSLAVFTADGSMLSASGLEQYPDGFADFERDIIALFRSVFA